MDMPPPKTYISASVEILIAADKWIGLLLAGARLHECLYILPYHGSDMHEERAYMYILPYIGKVFLNCAQAYY